MTNEQIYVQCDQSLRAPGCFNVFRTVMATGWSCLAATHTHTHTYKHTDTQTSKETVISVFFFSICLST